MTTKKPDRLAWPTTTTPQPVRALELAKANLPKCKDADYIIRILETKAKRAQAKQPAKAKRVAVRRLLRAAGEPAKTKRDWRVEADKWFARFIRLRDTTESALCYRFGNCITCGRRYVMDSIQCGHWIRREFWGTRFDERNSHGQCAHCNGYNGGMEQEHEAQIIKRYGQKVRDTLLLFKKVKQRQPSAQAFKAIAEKYEAKVNDLGGWPEKE